MSNIDLIPGAFRDGLQINRWLRQSAVALTVLTLFITGTFLWLRAQTVSIEQQLKELQSQKAISTQQRSDLENLNARRLDMQQQLDLLAGLRSGVVAEQIFVTMDRAFTNDNVWFTNWRFRRAGTPTKDAPNEKNTGYFIVITDDKSKKGETWKIETHMTIDGSAVDHAALSHFVSSLIDRPEIQSVRVVRSEMTRQHRYKLVNFVLEVVVATDGAIT